MSLEDEAWKVTQWGTQRTTLWVLLLKQTMGNNRTSKVLLLLCQVQVSVCDTTGMRSVWFFFVYFVVRQLIYCYKTIFIAQPGKQYRCMSETQCNIPHSSLLFTLKCDTTDVCSSVFGCSGCSWDSTTLLKQQNQGKFRSHFASLLYWLNCKLISLFTWLIHGSPAALSCWVSTFVW